MRGDKLSVILTKVRIRSHEAMPSTILEPDFRQDDGLREATSPHDFTSSRAYMRSTEQKEDA